MNVPAQTVQFEITDLQPTFLDYIQSQKDENTRTFNIQFLFEGDVLSLSGCTATATVTINNIMVEQELTCEVNETNNYVTVVVNAPYSGVMAVQVTLTDGTNTLTMPRPLFVRVARDIAETAQIDDNTHGSFAEVVREVADARGNYATLAQAINAKEVKSNKKTTLTGNESSNDFYPTTKAVADALNTKVKYMILGENDDLPQGGDEKTDYYKLENNNYIHYRWIDNDYEIISGGSITVDDALSDSSENPVQNKVVAKEVSDLKSAFNNCTFAGKLYFDLIANKYINIASGDEKPCNGWSCTDFIDVGGLASVSFYTIADSTYNRWYDENKEIIYSNFRTKPNQITTHAVPEGAKYFRLSNTTAAMKETYIIAIAITEIKEKFDAVDSSETLELTPLFKNSVAFQKAEFIVYDGFKIVVYAVEPQTSGDTYKVHLEIPGNWGIRYDNNSNVYYSSSRINVDIDTGISSTCKTWTVGFDSSDNTFYACPAFRKRSQVGQNNTKYDLFTFAQSGGTNVVATNYGEHIQNNVNIAKHELNDSVYFKKASITPYTAEYMYLYVTPISGTGYDIRIQIPANWGINYSDKTSPYYYSNGLNTTYRVTTTASISTWRVLFDSNTHNISFVNYWAARGLNMSSSNTIYELFSFRVTGTGLVRASEYNDLIGNSVLNNIIDTAVDSTDIIKQNRDIESFVINADRKYCLWNDRGSIKPVLTFGVLTDIHGYANNLKRYLDYCTAYSDYIDEKLCLGDMVSSLYGDDITYWDNMSGAASILRTLGNHDVWVTRTGGGYDNVDKMDAYTKYFSGKTSSWGITQPSGYAENGLMYYYKDYTDQKLRLIVIDCMYWDSAEDTWFVSTLESARQAGYAVMCTSHYNPVKTNMTPVGNFYSLDYGFSHLVYATGGQAKTRVDEFITNGGVFVCWVSGDSHYDACGVYTDATSGNKQLSLVFENAGLNSAWNDDNRIEGTRTQDSFNIVTVDTYSKLVKVVRIGCNCDRYLREKKCLVYNYETNTVIN